MSKETKSLFDLLVDHGEICEEICKRIHEGDPMAKLFLHEMAVDMTKAFEDLLGCPTLDHDKTLLEYMATKASCPILITSNVKKEREDKVEYLFHKLGLGSQSLHNVTGTKFRGGHTKESVSRTANRAIRNLLNEMYKLQQLNEMQPDSIADRQPVERVAAGLDEMNIDNIEDWFASIWDLVILYTDGFPERKNEKPPILRLSLDLLAEHAKESLGSGVGDVEVHRADKHKAIRKALWRALINGVYPALGQELKKQGKSAVTPAFRGYQKNQ